MGFGTINNSKSAATAPPASAERELLSRRRATSVSARTKPRNPPREPVSISSRQMTPVATSHRNLRCPVASRASTKDRGRISTRTSAK